MVQIKTEIPHGYTSARDDAHDVMAYVRELQEARPLSGREQDEFAKIEAIENMSGQIVDTSPLSMAAGTMVEIMKEFADDYESYGEVFQPSVDEELRSFLYDVIKREHPDLSDEDTAYLFAQVQDFPPAQRQEHREITEDPSPVMREELTLAA